MTAPGPVTFDYEAAEEAAAQLLATAESLLEALGVLELDRPVVTEDWEGRFRPTFDHELQVTASGGTFLVHMLPQMAAVVMARRGESEWARLAHEKRLAERAGGAERPRGGK